MERETFVGGCFRDFRTSSVTAREHRQYSIRCVLGEDGLCACVYLPADTHCMNRYPLSSGTFTMSPSLLHLHYCTIPPIYYSPHLGYSCLCDTTCTTNEPMQSLWVGQGERGDETGTSGISEKHGDWFSSCCLKVWLSFYFILTVLPFFHLPIDQPVSFTREYMDRSNQRLASSKKLKSLFKVRSGTREHQMQPDMQRMWSHVLPHIR